MTVTKQMPGTVIGAVPHLHRVMTENDHLLPSGCSQLRKFQRYERRNNLNFLIACEILKPRPIMTAGQDFYASIQLVCPFRKMAQIIESEIAKMVNQIIVRNNIVPSLYHDSIHLIHALEWTSEIGNSTFIIKVCIRSEKGLHDKCPTDVSRELHNVRRMDCTSSYP